MKQMSYFEAWFLGLNISATTQQLGIADNQGVDCLDIKKAAEEINNAKSILH